MSVTPRTLLILLGATAVVALALPAETPPAIAHGGGAGPAPGLTSHQPRAARGGQRRGHVHAAVLPASQGGSPKADWRGDAANSGWVAASGPLTLPAQAVAVQPVRFGDTSGVQLGATGSLTSPYSIVFTLGSGRVYSYNPDGTPRWAFPAMGSVGSYGADPRELGVPPSSPSLGADGRDYVGNDNGNLYQLDDASGAGHAIFSPAGSAPIEQTPKIGPGGDVYVGADDGRFYRLTPPTLAGAAGGAQAIAAYAVAATGSAQPATSVYSGTSQAPFRFYGEAALDPQGNAYAASSDTNPLGGSLPRVGTLYRISPTGAISWAAALRGEPVGAVLYAANPLTPTEPLVVVADRYPEVAAFDAATGALVWDVLPTVSTGGFVASPALSRDGTTLYAVNDSDTLYALNVATGQAVAGFGAGYASLDGSGAPVTGTVAIASGAASSPLVDAAGTIYLGGNTGALLAYSPLGAPLWTIPRGTGAGQSGSIGGSYYSPALAPDGTLYAAGNGASVRGFRAGAGGSRGQSGLPSPTVTATTVASATRPASPTPTASTSAPPPAVATLTATPFAAASPASTAPTTATVFYGNGGGRPDPDPAPLAPAALTALPTKLALRYLFRPDPRPSPVAYGTATPGAPTGSVRVNTFGPIFGWHYAANTARSFDGRCAPCGAMLYF